jgi:hypothetical protein
MEKTGDGGLAGDQGIAPKGGRRFLAKAMRKQKAHSKRAIHEIGSLLYAEAGGDGTPVTGSDRRDRRSDHVADRLT